MREGHELLKQQERCRIIEQAPPPTAWICWPSGITRREAKRIHYLPHRWIVQKNKIRVVYDASSHTKTNHSLNDLVHQGPNLTENLVGLLLNFRLYPIGLTADIEKAYLQISLNLLDRDATRFLWVKDYTKPPTGDNLRHMRFARVHFGVNASPCLLHMVLQDTLSAPPVNPWLLMGQHKFYVDNLLMSVRTPNEALCLFDAMRDRLGSIRMNLRDWATNSEVVENAIPEALHDPTEGITSVLGLKWDRKLDTLMCKMNFDLPTLGTKANILKYVASIYDPLGFFASCILDLKLLLRKCWKLKFQWNEELPSDLQAEWLKFRNDTLLIASISIPRLYWNFSPVDTMSLHVFCDASKKAYACCAYLVYLNETTKEATGSLAFAKVRVAPLNPLSTPKLELLGAVIGKRCIEFLSSQLDTTLKQVVLWTDSTTVLQWLHSVEVLQPFIQNRVNELRRTKDITFRYVPGNENPADFASRGKVPSVLENLDTWWKGPEWLPHERLWPLPPPNVETYETPLEGVSLVALALNTPRPELTFLTHNIEYNFSSWNARVRILKHVMRFCYQASRNPDLSETDLVRMAEKVLLLDLQKKYFWKELQIIKRGGAPLTNLDLFIQPDTIDADGNVSKSDGLI